MPLKEQLQRSKFKKQYLHSKWNQKKSNDFLNTIYLKFYIFVIFYYYISKKTQAKHIEFSAIRTEYIYKIYRKFLKIFFWKKFFRFYDFWYNDRIRSSDIFSIILLFCTITVNCPQSAPYMLLICFQIQIDNPLSKREPELPASSRQGIYY